MKPELYIVEGTKDAYYLVHSTDYCSCEDFLLRKVKTFSKPICYHVVGVLLANSLGLVQERSYKDPYTTILKLIESKTVDDFLDGGFDDRP